MAKFNVFIVAGILSSGFLMGAAQAKAQAGSFDPTFGTDGKVVFNFSAFPTENGGSSPDAALLDSLGNILVAAESDNSNTGCSQAALVRFLPTGRPDPAFGQSGRASTSFDHIASLATQADGKIVATAPGELCSGFTSTAVLTRFKSNGATDTVFGANGQIGFALPIEGQTVFSVVPGAVLVEPDSKIVVTAQEQAFETGCIPEPHKSCPGTLTTLIARFTNSGSPDKTFGVDGIVSGGPGINVGENGGFALQSDGSLLLQSLNGGLVELNAAGNFVSPVQIGTIVSTTSPSNPLILTGGKLLSTGEVSQGPGRFKPFTECVVSRADTSGDPDPAFQTTAFFFTGSKAGSSDQSACPNIATAPNGQTLVAGSSLVFNAPGLNPELAGDFGLARLNPLGGLDSSFGDGGIVTSNFIAEFGPSIILVQPDGKIVIVGTAVGNTPADSADGATTLALARFLAK